jgi:hypothetical protein
MIEKIQQDALVIFNVVVNILIITVYFLSLIVDLNCFFSYQIKKYYKERSLINLISTHSILFLSLMAYFMINSTKLFVTILAINFDSGNFYYKI